MSPAKNAAEESSHGDASLACFEGKNIHLLSSIREYFMQHSIQILDLPSPERNSDNDQPPAPISCLYHVIIGDRKDVTSSLSRNNIAATQRIVLLQNDSALVAEEIAKKFTARVAVIGDSAISQEESRVLFGFLFTKTDPVLVLKKLDSSSSQMSNSPPPQKKSHPWSDDALRISSLTKNLYAKKHKTSSTSFSRTGLFFSLCIAGIFSIFFLHFFSLLLGGVLLYTNITSLTKRNITPIEERTAFAFIGIAQDTSRLFLSPLKYSPLSSWGRRYEQGLQIVAKLAQSERSVFAMSKNMTSWTQILFSSNSPDSGVFTQVIQSAQQLTHLATQLQEIRGEITSLSSHEVIKNFLSSPIALFEHQLRKGEDMLEFGARSATLFSLLGGIDSPKTYLLLLTNPMEIRPTGGFIGTVAILTLNKGRMDDLVFHDVYEIDGQLKGHVDPPAPLRSLLSQEHWYLRDSNWDPDHRIAHKQAMWFLEKSIGKKVDGVISINLHFIEDLLSLIGTVTIPDTNETYTSDTLFTNLNTKSNEQFFPGSTKKKDTISALGRALIQKVQDAKISPRNNFFP